LSIGSPNGKKSFAFNNLQSVFHGRNSRCKERFMTKANLQQKKQAKESKDVQSVQKRSKIGRFGAGAVGQNWTESPNVAQKGRYADENKVQGSDPDLMIDTDVSEAV
jgi:hypothetical protein